MSKTADRLYDVSFLSLSVALFGLPFDSIGINLGFMMLSTTNLFIVTSFGTGVTGVLLSNKLTLTRPQSLLLLLAGFYFGFYIIRAFIASEWGTTLQLISRIGNGLFVVATLINITNKRKFELALGSFVAGVVTLSALTILAGAGVLPPVTSVFSARTLFGFQIPFKRTLGMPIGFGTFGVLSSLSISVLLFLTWEQERRWKQLVSGILICLLLLGVVVSQSRSTYIAVLGVLSTAIIGRHFVGGFSLSPYEKWTVRSLLIIGVFISPLLAIELSSIAPWSLYARIEQTAAGVSHFLAQPWLGTGRFIYVDGKIIHNSFAHEFGTVGIIGGGLFVVIFAYSVTTVMSYVTLSSVSRYPLALCAGLMGVLIENLFYFGSHKHSLWFILAMCASVGVATELKTPGKEERTENSDTMS